MENTNFLVDLFEKRKEKISILILRNRFDGNPFYKHVSFHCKKGEIGNNIENGGSSFFFLVKFSSIIFSICAVIPGVYTILCFFFTLPF